MEKTKVLLVDDHPVVTDGLTSLLSRETEIEVIGSAANGELAKRFILNEQRPDVVIVDLSMPEMDGLELTNYIKKNHPGIKVIVLSMQTGKQRVAELVKAKVDGYLLKESRGKHTIVDAILAVRSGDIYFDQKVQKKLAETLIKDSTLTTREVEVLRYIYQGLTSQEIAKEMNIAVNTVEAHRKNMFKKTGAKNVVDLIRYGIENDLL